MFWRDPSSPHFHALYGEYEASIDVRDVTVLRGELPKRALSLVREWAAERRDGLMEDLGPMQPIADSEQNPAAQVAPEIHHAVPWRLIAVTPLTGSRLHVTFVDGTTGEVDMGEFLSSPGVKGTVFEALRDPNVFAAARIVLGAVQWPSGADLAPDAMYDAIRGTGAWVLG